MAGEQLQDEQGLLAGYADNVAGQILAVNSRNFVVSSVSAIGFIEDEVGFTIPITDGVPTIINPILPAHNFTGNFWTLDGNNAFIPAYGSVTIAPGLERLCDIRMLFEGTPDTGGVQNYSLQARIGGVPVGKSIGIETDSQVLFPVDTDQLYDVSVGDPIDFQITGVGTSADVDVTGLMMKVVSYLI